MLPMDLSWNILVLLPKVNADTQGIGWFDVLWKVMESVINTQIKMVMNLHDVLHGFLASRVTGIAIMELKMVQELASIDQDPLFLVFLDLQKAYDTLDYSRLLHTLEGYRVVPNIRGLLAEL